MINLSQIKKYLALLGLFWQQKSNSQILRWNLICVFIQIILLVIKFNDLPPQVPLFYSLPTFDSQLGQATHLFFIPIFSITVGLINNFIAAIFLQQKPVLAKFLVVFSLIFSFLSLVTLFNIIRLVT